MLIHIAMAPLDALDATRILYYKALPIYSAGTEHALERYVTERLTLTQMSSHAFPLTRRSKCDSWQHGSLMI